MDSLPKILTVLEYDKALQRLDQIFDSQPGEENWEELLDLIQAVEDYEDSQGWL